MGTLDGCLFFTPVTPARPGKRWAKQLREIRGGQWEAIIRTRRDRGATQAPSRRSAEADRK